MNIDQLKALVAQKESETLEFKKSTGQLHAAFETICAFLNGEGGTVLIGVTDNGHIIGQEVADSTRQAIAHELSKLEPTAQIDISYIPLSNGNGRQVIMIDVKPGSHSPYIYDGRAFQRTQSTTLRMSQHRYEQLLVERGQLNHSWEELIAADYTVDDLDHDEIRRTIQDGIRVNRITPDAMTDSVEAALNRMELLENGRLKNAAIILFAKKLFPKYAQCLIKLGRFNGTSYINGFIDNQQVYGNIFKLLSEADHFIRRHLPIASLFSLDSFQRIDKPALPPLAVREAIVNAVCHRDYSEKTSAITLAIFDDRLEIWNCGTLPLKLQLSDLRRTHNSFPRNKLIANVLYSRKYFEKWGSGTINMIDICRNQGIPEPEFEEYSGGLAVVFKFKEPIGIASQIQQSMNQPSLNARQEEILALLQNKGALSVNDIFSQLRNPPSIRTVKADLSILQKKVLIEQQGKGRSTVWKIKN